MGFVVALIAFIIAVAATPLARRAAFAFGVLDQPGPLKLQRQPVPYLGGAAVFVAVAAVLTPVHAAWVLPLLFAAVLGAVDDIRSLSPRVRLIAEIALGCVAGAIAPADVRFGFAITAVLVVVCVNAVNLIDGMDALASAVVALAAIGFVIIGGDALVLALGLCGALAGFLVFNRPPARIYLGDSGSYLLGTALGLLAACALDKPGSGTWIAVPFLLGVPLADMAITVVRRRRDGKPLFHGDRAHVYDQLADRGWSVGRVVATCALVQVAATTLGLTVLDLRPLPALALAISAVTVAAVVAWRAGLVTSGAAA